MPNSLGDEVCLYLQQQSLGLNFNGAGSINCFSTLLPDQPDLAAAVLERGGMGTLMRLTGTPGLSTTYIHPYKESKFDRPVFQVFVRSGMTGYTAGQTLIQGVFNALQGVVETTLNAGGAWFHLISDQQSPVYLGRDLKERHQWSVNFLAQWDNPYR